MSEENKKLRRAMDDNDEELFKQACEAGIIQRSLTLSQKPSNLPQRGTSNKPQEKPF